MTKTKFSFLLILFVVGQAFAQQQTRSFAEHWFGITPQQKEAVLERGAQSQPNHASAMMPLSQSNANIPRVEITLDLRNPTVPTSFELHPTGHVWVETVTNNYQWFSFNNSTFSFSKNLDGMAFGSPTGNISSWSWSGFTYSRNGDNTNHGQNSFNWILHQFGNMAAGGIKTDACGNVTRDKDGVVMTCTDTPYIVGFMSVMEIMMGEPMFGSTPSLSINLDQEYEAVGIYVNMTPWTYFGNRYGDGFARPLNIEGDFFRLVIHGVNASGNATGTTVVHYFAKFENGALTQSSNWEWVDLASLGEIYGVFFVIEGSDAGMFGLNAAAYFVMDRFTVSREMTPEEQILALQQQVSALKSDTAALNLTIAGLNDDVLALQSDTTQLHADTLRLYNKILALQNDTAELHYLLTLCRDDSAQILYIEHLHDSIDGLHELLTICNNENSKLNDTISERDSRIAMLLQNISDLEDDTTQLYDEIRELWRLLNECEAYRASNAPFTQATQIEFFPNPVTDQLQIIHDWKPGDIVELFNMNGHRVFSAQPNISPFTIDMSPFPTGNYILRIGNRVAKIVKR